MSRFKFYVGKYKQDGPCQGRKLIRSFEDPTDISHPEFAFCIGPFKTKRGAQFCANYPRSILQHVDEYEDAAKKEEDERKKAYNDLKKQSVVIPEKKRCFRCNEVIIDGQLITKQYGKYEHTLRTDCLIEGK